MWQKIVLNYTNLIFWKKVLHVVQTPLFFQMQAKHSRLDIMKSSLRIIIHSKHISSELFNYLKKFGIMQMHIRRYRLKKIVRIFTLLCLTIYDLAWTTEDRETSITTNTASASSKTERKKPEYVKQPSLEYTVILAILPYRTCLEDHLLGLSMMQQHHRKK